MPTHETLKFIRLCEALASFAPDKSAADILAAAKDMLSDTSDSRRPPTRLRKAKATEPAA